MAETEPGGVRVPQFDVVLRGYDRTQVEKFIADRLGTDGTAEHPPFPGFDVVLRGYDRTQVEKFVADRLGTDGTVSPPSSPGRIDLPGSHSVPAFDMVFRGYDPRRVDALTRRITATVAGDAPTPVTRAEAEGATFRTALRGYERQQVRAWITDALPRLPE